MITLKSELPQDSDGVPGAWSRAAGESQRAVTGGAVRVWEERRDVGNGSKQQRAGLRAFIAGQREDNVVLLPHVEGIVGKWMHWGRMAGGHVVGVVVFLHVFIIRWTQ